MRYLSSSLFEIQKEFDKDHYLIEFLPRAERFVCAKYGYGQSSATIDDLTGVALDALVDTCTLYEAWVGNNQIDVTDGRLFWHLCKKQIGWAVSKYWRDSLSEKATDIGALETEEWSGFIGPKRSSSLTHQDIVAFISTLTLRDHIFLGLRVFDGLATTHIAHIAAVTKNAASNAYLLPARKALAYAITQVSNVAMPSQKFSVRKTHMPAGIGAYILKEHGLTIEQYAEFTLACYRADVSYVVEILDTAHGMVRKKETRRLSMVPAADLDRAEKMLLAGQRNKDISAATGIDSRRVSEMRRGSNVA